MKNLLDLFIALLIFGSTLATAYCFAYSHVHNKWLRILTILFLCIFPLVGSLYFASFLRAEFRLGPVYRTADYFRALLIPVVSFVLDMVLLTLRPSEVATADSPTNPLGEKLQDRKKSARTNQSAPLH